MATRTLVASGDTAVVGFGAAGSAGAQVLVSGQAAADHTLVLRGIGSQTGRLLLGQNSTPTTVFQVKIDGTVTATFLAHNAETGSYLELTTTTMTINGRTATANVVLKVKGMASQSGRLTEWINSANAVLAGVEADGKLKFVAGNEQTTIGAAGGASALPATPTKYFQVKDSAGTTLIIPAYAAA